MNTVITTLMPFLAGGFVIARIGQGVPAIADAGVRQGARFLNRWVIWVAMPALVMVKIHALPDFSFRDPQVWLPVSQPWIHFALVFLGIRALGDSRNWSRPAIGALILTIGLGNTSFVGIPLLNAILGPESLPTAILLDQWGSFLALTTVGMTVAQSFSQQTRTRKTLLPPAIDWIRRPLAFPPFIALLVAFASRGMEIPAELMAPLRVLSATLTPAALISVGLSLRFSALRRKETRRLLGLGLALKLLVLPLAEGLFYWSAAHAIPGFDPTVRMTVLLEASMATMITAGIVASDAGLDLNLSQLMVGVSIPLSLVTVPLWHLIWSWMG